MTQPYPRRQLLVAVGSLSLAGCLVESETSSADASEESSQSRTNSSSHPERRTSAGSQSADSRPPNNASSGITTSLDAAGIAVETIRIDRIVESLYQSQIIADIAISNVGPAQYGTLELRADAYYEPPDDDRTYHPPRVTDRTAVGRSYIERTYDSFDSGTRTLNGVVIQYDADDSNGSTDPAEFDIEIAVRWAEPL